MSKKTIKNTAASVKEKLLNLAHKGGRIFDSILTQYFQERLLYRLSISRYREQFVLKGALLFVSYEIAGTRPTKDIDLLARSTSNETESIVKKIKEILQITCEDGVTFNSEGISIEKINKDADYAGARITLSATLEKAEKNIQIDMGFGDVIVSGPVLIEYPVLLEQNPRPEIYVYSLSSAISEKLEAVAKLGFLNSRMKDFYDIAFLSKTNLLKMSDLYEAITRTFENRKTLIGSLDIVFSDDFAASRENQEKWSVFANANGGWIVFGVVATKDDYQPVGVELVDKVQNDFLSALRADDKVNHDIAYSARRQSICSFIKIMAITAERRSSNFIRMSSGSGIPATYSVTMRTLWNRAKKKRAIRRSRQRSGALHYASRPEPGFA